MSDKENKEETIRKYKQYYESEIKDDIEENCLNYVEKVVYNMMKNDRAPIQYVRSRMKKPMSLKGKLNRKWYKYKDTIEEEIDITEEITDLAGIRVLVLYRDQIPMVNELVWDFNGWSVEECTAYYDETRHNDKRWFMNHGFYPEFWYVDNMMDEMDDNDRTVYKKIRRTEGRDFETQGERNIRDYAYSYLNKRPLLKPTERGYSSVHYIIKPRVEHTKPYPCELQLRTIHQDAWGEFDHDLKYPGNYVDNLAEDMIRRLSNLLDYAEDIVQDIRRSPANALISQHITNVHHRKNDVSNEDIIDEIVEEFLSEAKYLGRSAPLAAVKILRECVKRRNDSEYIGPQDCITTLDFGSPDDWSHRGKIDDPVRKLYLDAHQNWVEGTSGTNGAESSNDRKIIKYFVWGGEEKLNLNGDNLLLKYANSNMEVRIIQKNIFDYLHNKIDNELEKIKLRSTQFFVWDIQDPSPMLIGDIDSYGFYSPARTSDLTSGIVHLTDVPDDDGSNDIRRKRCKHIFSYVRLLDFLYNNDIIYNLEDWKGETYRPLSPGHKEIINDNFSDFF